MKLHSSMEKSNNQKKGDNCLRAAMDERSSKQDFSIMLFLKKLRLQVGIHYWEIAHFM